MWKITSLVQNPSKSPQWQTSLTKSIVEYQSTKQRQSLLKVGKKMSEVCKYLMNEVITSFDTDTVLT